MFITRSPLAWVSLGATFPGMKPSALQKYPQALQQMLPDVAPVSPPGLPSAPFLGFPCKSEPRSRAQSSSSMAWSQDLKEHVKLFKQQWLCSLNPAESSTIHAKHGPFPRASLGWWSDLPSRDKHPQSAHLSPWLLQPICIKIPPQTNFICKKPQKNPPKTKPRGSSAQVSSPRVRTKG